MTSWLVLHTLCVTNPLLGFYGGEGGARLLSSHVCTSRARVTDAEDSHRINVSQEAHVLLRLATNRMGKTFGARKCPGYGAVPTHLCRQATYRHDSDHDSGGRQCAQATIVMTQTMTSAADNAHGALMETDYNRYNTSSCNKTRSTATTKPGLAETTLRLELTTDAPRCKAS